MIRPARRAWVSVSGRWRRSSPISATSAVSMATSVPIAPMAMPTSAVASAGASLMPSPTMATTWPWRCRRATSVGLVVGQQLGVDVVDAGLRGERVRGALVVAGEHRRRAMPAACSAATVGGVGAQLVADRDGAERHTVALDEHDGGARRPGEPATRSRRAGRRRSNPACRAARRARPSTAAGEPCAGHRCRRRRRRARRTAAAGSAGRAGARCVARARRPAVRTSSRSWPSPRP